MVGSEAGGGRLGLPTLDGVSLFWRVFAINALVLAVATAVLVLSPATVSSPVAVAEALVLALGLGACWS